MTVAVNFPIYTDTELDAHKADDGTVSVRLDNTPHLLFLGMDQRGKAGALAVLARLTAAVEALPDDTHAGQGVLHAHDEECFLRGCKTDPAENARRNIEKHSIPTGTDDPLLLAMGAAPLAPVWRTLTFGDLRAGDVVKLDEDGPVETVNTSEDDGWGWWLATSQRCGHYYEEDPVLVRHPRPEVGQ